MWRLFIGRKYNPLRQRVDSCDYAQNQLFIGTLGFTVLLFLLPTTLMYYTVFATVSENIFEHINWKFNLPFQLRLAIFIINGCLGKLRYILNRLPLYTFYLWIRKSPSIAGNLYLKWQKQDGKNVHFDAHLYTLSLINSMLKFVPFDNDSQQKNCSLTVIVHNILTGVIL